MSASRWIGFASGRRARLATIALLVLQLGGCALDLVSEQVSLIAGFCTAAPGDGALEAIAGFVWLVLAFSWVAGLLALRIQLLRPVYWALALAIVPAWFGQLALLERQTLYCDAP